MYSALKLTHPRIIKGESISKQRTKIALGVEYTKTQNGPELDHTGVFSHINFG